MSANEPLHSGTAEPTLGVAQTSRGSGSAGGNLASLGLIQIFRIVSGVAINVMVMRALGVEGYGVYGYVTTLVALFSFGSSMGLDRLIKREIARDEAVAGRYVASALVVAGATSVATAIAIVTTSTLSDGRPDVVLAAALAACSLGLQALAVVPNAYFHAIRRMNLAVRPSLYGRITLIVVTAVALFSGMGIQSVFTAQVLDGACALFVSALVFRREAKGVQLATNPSEVRELVATTVPFGLNALFASLYLSADVLLLAHFHDDDEVGIYRGGVLLISFFPLIAETLSNGIYPRMSRYLGQVAQAGSELRFACRVLLALSIPAAVGGILTAEPLMVFIGGADFARSTLPFMVMAPLLPLRFLNNAFSMTLSALNRQGDRTRGVFFAAVFNVGANLLVLPAYGAVGAACTTLATEALLLMWTTWRVRPLVDRLALAGPIIRIAMPAVVMGAAILVLPSPHVLLTIFVGVVIYGVGATLTGAIRRSDLGQLRGV